MANRLRQPQSTTDKNAAILRELLKRPENRVCADCHVATHPRWASWSLGVFICIRCSGIHRGMGTHISRVKSADLDAWTDEQTEMMMKWGNRRANKYWEASLPPSHIPSDSKMENFIRTKYSSKRWALSPVPPQDPSILDDIDSSSDTQEDSLPLSIVKQKLSSPPQPSRKPASQSRSQAPTTTNLLGNDTPPPSRSTNSEISNLRSLTPSPKSSRARNDRISNQSLLGLDFDSPVRTRSAPVAEPATTVPTTTNSTSSFTTSGGGPSVARPASRNDLKNIILRLYAPKAVTPHTTSPALQSTAPAPASASAPVVTSSNALGDLNSAFGGLSFSSAGSSAAAAKSPTSGFTSPLTSPPLSTSAFATTNPATTTSTSTTGSNGFGGMGSSSGHIPGKLSFGQTSNAPIPPATAPIQPSSFTVPIKRTSPALTSLPITTQPTRTTPPGPQTSQYNPSITNANKDILADISHSKWGSTFNLSNSKTNNITTGSTPSLTGPAAKTKSGSSGLQLLSSLTPTTGSGGGMGVSGLTSTGPTTGRNFSSFDDPWASTSGSTGAGGAGGAGNTGSSTSAMGGLVDFTSDPWSSMTAPSTTKTTTTTTTTGTTSTSNNFPSFSTPTTTNAFSGFSSAPATNTSSSSSFAPPSTNSGAFTAPTSSAFDSWGSTTTAPNDKGWSTTSSNDKSWGNMTSASASTTTTTNGKRNSKESGFDDFGLFETADVWK